MPPPDCRSPEARMRIVAGLLAALALSAPLAARAQDGRAGVEAVAHALGAPALKSVEYTATGAQFAVGQSAAPGTPWPRFTVRSLTRTLDYENAALREEWLRARAEDPPRGGGLPVVGELRQVFVLSGEHAWNVSENAEIPAPIALLERQLQLWASPHGVIRAALAASAVKQGRVIAFTLPNRIPVKAVIDPQNLIERVEAVLPSPVLGDMPVEFAYADYKDYGGVKFPARIRQTAGGFPALDVTVTGVRPNVPVSVGVPDGVRQTPAPYARVATQMVADGVWYVSGGTHHSVVIEMKDHLVVVESPLNDERALAVLAEARGLAPGKPVRYVVNSHHHFDHAGGLRAAAGEGATIVTHEINRAYFERALATPATVRPDHLAKSGRAAVVEGVRDRRVLSDGTRTIELHHIAGNAHDDGLLMAWLPKEKLLVEADVFTPLPPGAPPARPLNFSLNLVDNLKRLGMDADRILPLHGRIVPAAELAKAVGHEH
ncbi:MAG TPA: MBL fold metallo-hydrolase [Methylomirabilota bacterium]|nr:MBL fold metallo-hydrolase [Methylomirabilota bacterium]